MDLITKLPLVAGKNAILVVCNKLSKITHFVATTEETLAERLARLFQNNAWKLYGLLESIVLDRGPQFAAKMTKELNIILDIETKLLIAFYPQTDGQMERMNQELKQYLRFFIDHRQKNWLEWLALAEFTISNKIHSTTKVSPFIANYRRELRIEIDLRRKEKIEKAMEFVERMRKVQEESKATLKKVQKEMKRQADRERKKVKEWKVGDRVILSMKDLMFKKRLARNLVDQYISSYTIDKVISANAVKLQLPNLMRIHPIVNII